MTSSLIPIKAMTGSTRVQICVPAFSPVSKSTIQPGRYVAANCVNNVSSATKKLTHKTLFLYFRKMTSVLFMFSLVE
ncbi:hypothetical protein DWZ97_13090 [Firmicutes bacterium AF36-19BH]|nr:hypothetical protein DWZ97_13090 [Firmicutes bacterium AF36-19BH]